MAQTARFVNTERVTQLKEGQTPTARTPLYAFALENPVTIVETFYDGEGRPYAYMVQQDNMGFITSRVIAAEFIQVTSEG